MKGLMDANAAIGESFIFKPHLTVEELEQAWLEIAPDVTDRAPLGVGVYRGLIVRACDSKPSVTVLLDTCGACRITVLPQEQCDGRRAYIRVGSRSAGGGKAVWCRQLLRLGTTHGRHPMTTASWRTAPSRRSSSKTPKAAAPCALGTLLCRG